MSDIQADLLKLSKTHDLSRISLRAAAELIGQKGMSAGHIQHHFKMLEKRGLLFIDRKAKVQRIGDGRQPIHTMPNGRDVMFIPFKSYKIVDIDGQAAIIDTGEQEAYKKGFIAGAIATITQDTKGGTDENILHGL